MLPRPSPDALLRAAKRETRGRLKIFLGAAPGVGKTFEMLREGAERLRAGVDTVIGVVETHGRQETQALVAPFEQLPRRRLDYQGHALDEMDLDGLLARAPALALVDELAHSNAPGSRHPKRWQDVEELRDAGIDVYTTLNVQHVESLNDVVASFTKVRVRETVPDSIFDDAEIELVDLPPDELIERLKDGKVYIPAEASRALGHFFSKANLSALREMALRRAALSVDRAMLDHLDALAVPGTYAGGERVLVAVSELPGAEALVRAGKRLADALRAPWQAVFIETPRAAQLPDDARRRVADALRLAASLGATVSSVPAETVIEGLRTHVAGMRATQLVLGKSQRSWWFELRHGSVVATMLRASGGLAVHVLPADAPPLPAARRLPPLGRARDYLSAALLVAATVALGKLAEPLIGVGGTDLLFLPPVIIAASRFPFAVAAFAAIVAGLAYNFFFLPPIYTFTITDPQSVLTFFVLMGVALFTARLAGRLRARATLGTRSAQENAAVAAFGQALARASDWEGTSRTVCEEMARLLDCTVVLLARRDGVLTRTGAAPADAPAFGPVDQAAADWTFTSGEPGGIGTATLVSSDWQFHPLKTSLGVLAVVGLARASGGEPVGAERALLLATLLGQAALAHERLRLEAELRQVSVLSERDRLRAALLSSIGHDLRTPLTAIAAATDALGQAHPGDPVVPIARAEVARLRRFLDNLLDMVRIDSGALEPTPEPVDLTDAVASAAHDLRDLLRGHRLDLCVPPDLPLVRADPRLLHHILLNLLANAAVHGRESGTITLRGVRERRHVVLSVEDDGPGLPPGAEARIFETFARGEGNDRSGGSGLGLAIAKGFADAMGVELSAGAAPAGGAMFCLRFAVD
ncbi:MAG: histidine kinase [Proteobacteria bacterium SG_bin5]|nr:sensor histidine kinase KdpD [Sphingomonas sp.]OQW43035.1 MAG: histidine kinase [Proteobacteria bacterium SG_bin5]